jgi:hypothetical protein
MPATCNVNNMTVVHAGSSGMSTALPDACKTPTPGGPVPIPYPNIAQSSDASDVSSTVTVDGNGVMVKGSKFAMSSGDEAGSALGVVSSKIKGTAEFKNLSSDVKFDGKAVARLSDPMGQNQGSDNAAGPAEVQGPLVVVDASQIGQTQEEACEKVKDKEVKDHKKGAHDAGMVQGDYDSIRETCQQEGVSCTFRDTNQACLRHLEAGVPSKGHDVLTKTFPAGNLSEADQELAGLVSTLEKKPPAGEIIQNAGSKLREPPLTGDYDMMDMLEGDGSRIAGESPRDIGMRDALNSNLPSGGEPPRIMHGCQSEYGNYLKQHPGEPPIKDLFKPEAPLTAFDKDGKVYRLETKEDVMNYYKCKGASTPPEWNVQAK